jgi:signal transduction histidine kinase
LKILVVDDEKFNQVIAKDIIEAKIPNDGVIVCSSPENVMPILAQDRDIGIILLDIIMPKTDGVSLLKEIRRKDEYKDIQIIMFTGITDKGSFKACFENGADDYINKPIDETEFIARMQAAVRTRRHIVALEKTYGKISEQYRELQEVTQQLKDTQFYLLQKEKLASLGELAAGVAHEINNPIGFVGSNLDTLEKYLARTKSVILSYRNFAKYVVGENIDSRDIYQAKQVVEEIDNKKMDVILEDFEPIIKESKDGVDRIASIVRSLRNFARSGSEEEMVINDLNQTVEEALLIMRNDIKYTASIETRLTNVPNVLCNKGQIAQVLINILHNASQAIKSQASEALGSISIATYRDGSYAVCKISDDGPGIKQEILNRIFDPFFTTKDVGNGTGLGLSIAYGIIKKHGGELLVESEFGNGATFIIKLPCEG